MGLKGQLIAEIEVKSSGDLFHDLFATKPHHIATISPTHIQGCDVHEGEFGKAGSTILWNYTLNGKACVAKERIEDINVEKKSITFNVIDGDLKKEYKSFVIHIHVTTETNSLNLVKWVFEYEKLHDDVAHPTLLLDFVLNVSKHIETHHLNA